MVVKLKVYDGDRLQVKYSDFKDETSFHIKRTWFCWLYQNLYNLFTGTFEYVPRIVGIIKGYTLDDVEVEETNNGRVGYIIFDKCCKKPED